MTSPFLVVALLCSLAAPSAAEQAKPKLLQTQSASMRAEITEASVEKQRREFVDHQSRRPTTTMLQSAQRRSAPDVEKTVAVEKREDVYIQDDFRQMEKEDDQSLKQVKAD